MEASFTSCATPSTHKSLVSRAPPHSCDQAVVKGSFIIDSMKVFYLIFSMASVMSSSMPYISEDRDDTGIPVTCSKCNETFQTDSDYLVHHNEMHTEI
jgi:hypothetical protein